MDMPIPPRIAPALESRHLRDARLYANRTDMMRALPIVRGGVVAEVGVAHGDFSEVILDTVVPKSFYAFDIFRMHEV